MPTFKISASSSAGCVRENNEDMILIGDRFIRNDSLYDIQEFVQNRLIFALADGMGGHNCGEVASSDVLHNLQFFYYDMPVGLHTTDFNEAIYEWLSSMNNIIDAKGRVDAQFKNMGTTLVALAFYEDHFYWMNCGDSRLYRFRQNKLQQLTTDHSLNNLTGEAVHSHIITNCIGGGCSGSYIDILEFTEDVQVGDVFLLCSDGLSDMVPDRDIETMLSGSADAKTLCDAAEKAGGFDNVSAILVNYLSAQ
jgi:protein phosphatase